jgi:hypothetical protein
MSGSGLDLKLNSVYIVSSYELTTTENLPIGQKMAYMQNRYPNASPVKNQKMGTYEENREKIRKRLYDINTTLDRNEAYEATVDYVMKVAQDLYKQGISDIKNWNVYTDDWNDQDTEERLISIGVKKDKDGTDTAT